jgi:hypothetical protein
LKRLCCPSGILVVLLTWLCTWSVKHSLSQGSQRRGREPTAARRRRLWQLRRARRCTAERERFCRRLSRPALHRFPGAVPRCPRVAAALPFLRASGQSGPAAQTPSSSGGLRGRRPSRIAQLLWSELQRRLPHSARAPASSASFNASSNPCSTGALQLQQSASSGPSSNPSSFKVFLFVILLVVSGLHACTKKASKIDAFVICMQLMCRH